MLGELTVVVHDGLYVGSIEPVLLAFPDEGDGLGIELLVVGAIAGVNGTGELDAYEAAASCGIAEDTDFVAGGNERGAAGQRFELARIGALDFHLWKLKDVLEKSLLKLGLNLIDLVEVDK